MVKTERPASSTLLQYSQQLWTSYNKETPSRLKLIDSYMVFLMLTGISQFVYCCIVGTFPYNAFLAGFISTVGAFVFAANLRMQSNPSQNADCSQQEKCVFKTVGVERAFADFVFCNLVLFLFVINYLG